MNRLKRRALVLAALILAAAAAYLRADGKDAGEKQPQLPLSPGKRAGVRVPGAFPLLPPRALLQISTEELTTQADITAIAFAPDGRTVVATGAGLRIPRAAFFDVQTGRMTKELIPPERPEGRSTVRRLFA